ncbi:MAG: hypothetical protein Q9220_007405 [cf. Caloplaca sp. 1 TL-2023]
MDHNPLIRLNRLLFGVCSSPAGGMLDHVSQAVTMCPGKTYTLSAHVGVTSTDSTDYPSFKILLDNQVLVPKQPPCTQTLYCAPSWDGSFYREVTAVVTAPASGKANFIIEVSAAGKTSGGYILFDTINLSPQ